jgi:hypothetical protein
VGLRVDDSQRERQEYYNMVERGREERVIDEGRIGQT